MNDGTADRPVMAGLHRQDRDGVRMITLDRPEARNAFNDDLYDGVARALSEAASWSQLPLDLATPCCKEGQGVVVAVAPGTELDWADVVELGVVA